MGQNTEKPEITLYTMQAAIGLSPTNKACTILPNGDTFAIQEDTVDIYRIWIISASGVLVWGGLLEETEIDNIPTKYGAEPGKKVWLSMGLVTDPVPLFETIDTAIRLLAGNISQLNTQLQVVLATLENNTKE